jgi:RNA polymerase sigma-32 factor
MGATSIALNPSSGSFEKYLAEIDRYPILEEKEKRRLARSVRLKHDYNAAVTLINGHLRFVVYIAKQYSGYGLPLEDLVQEGNVGLIKAVRHYDPQQRASITTYSSYWIRTHILEYVLKNWRIVKIATTKSRRKLFYKLRGIKRRLKWLGPGEVDTVAKTLDVKTSEVREMEHSLYLEDISLDMTSACASQEKYLKSMNCVDPQPTPDESVMEQDFFNTASRELDGALAQLDERSRLVIEKRWLVDEAERSTLKQLAALFRISAERVRQIEMVALIKLRSVMEDRLYQ